MPRGYPSNNQTAFTVCGKLAFSNPFLFGTDEDALPFEIGSLTVP